jgi:hypothetical protein
MPERRYRTAGLAALAVAVLLGCARPASAQLPVPQPPGPFVLDVRGVTVGIPQDPSFYPPLPPGTVVPTRGFGLDLGAHIYRGRLGPARLGFGISLVQIRGTATTPPGAGGTTATTTTSTTSTGTASTGTASTNTSGDDSGDDTPATPVVYPDIKSSVRLIAPELSLNFGTGAGWSYISAGLSLGQVTTEGTADADGTALSRDSGRTTGFNVGAGARWFVNRHLGVGFDLRLHHLSTATIFAAAAGVSLK